MKRALRVLSCLVVLWATAGCKQLEKEVDYDVMTGAIPADSPLSLLGSGKYQ